MAEPIGEYTVRDFSPVDRQIEQIAEREKLVTEKLRLANLFHIVKYAVIGLIALGIFFILLAIAYRIAFPPEPKIIETTRVVEKIVQPSRVANEPLKETRIVDSNNVENDLNSEQESFDVNSLNTEESSQASQEIERRLDDAGVNNSEGSISASLSWDNYNDLDLIIEESDGNLIYFKKKRSSTNGILDVDANANNSTKRSRMPVENIQWPNGNAPKGEYLVKVMFYRKAPDEADNGSTPFRVRLTHNRKTRLVSGVFPNNTPNQTSKTVAKIRID